jgi:hypothetical protein
LKKRLAAQRPPSRRRKVATIPTRTASDFLGHPFGRGSTVDLSITVPN